MGAGALRYVGVETTRPSSSNDTGAPDRHSSVISCSFVPVLSSLESRQCGRPWSVLTCGPDIAEKGQGGTRNNGCSVRARAMETAAVTTSTLSARDKQKKWRNTPDVLNHLGPTLAPQTSTALTD